MSPASVERPYGWVIVAVGTVGMLLGFGANVTVSVLIGPLESEFGYPRAEISFAYTMVTIGAAVGGLVWGTLSDRFGARWIALLGAVTLSGAVAAVSLHGSLRTLHALYLVIGGIGFACLFTPILALIGLWFDRRKGLALGAATAGGAIGQGIVPFVVSLMITEWSWRDAMLYLGLGYAAILLPLVLLLRPPPILDGGAQAVQRSDANLWGLAPRISITWLGVAAIFCCICMAAPIIHLVPLGTDMGLTPRTATGLLTAMMATGMFGRIAWGLIADRIGGLYTYALASLGQTLVVFWFTQTQSLAALYVLSVLFGFSFSGVMTCLIICAREAAPLRITGFAVAVVTAAGWVGMGLGGYQGGYFFDLTGAYTTSYALAAAAGVANLALVGSLILYRRAEAQPVGA